MNGYAAAGHSVRVAFVSHESCFAIVAITLPALGTGANTAIFQPFDAKYRDLRESFITTGFLDMYAFWQVWSFYRGQKQDAVMCLGGCSCGMKRLVQYLGDQRAKYHAVLRWLFTWLNSN